MHFSYGRKYGRQGTEGGKIVKALLDVAGPRRFQLRKYVCTAHSFENGKHPVYDVKSEHFAANVIGRDGITVSHGAHFISNSHSAVTPALMHWLMHEYATTGNTSKINRNLFSLWGTAHTERFKQWSQGLNEEERTAAAALVVESSELMHRCLPGGEQIGSMCRAIHDVVYKPIIPHLENALAAINGGIVSFDGGHATSQSISVDRPAATTPLSMSEAAESQAGSAGARQPGVKRQRVRTYIKVIILNVTGYNGAPIRCGRLIPSESHEALEVSMLRPIAAARASRLGPLRAASAVACTDAPRRDLAFLTQHMQRISPAAHKKFGDFFFVVVADLPHAKRLVLSPLAVAHCDYGTMEYITTATFSRLLRPRGRPTTWDTLSELRQQRKTTQQIIDERGLAGYPNVMEYGQRVMEENRELVINARQSKTNAKNILGVPDGKASLRGTPVGGDDIVAVHMRRVLDGEPVDRVPDEVTKVITDSICGDLVEALPWHKLMSQQRYDDVLGIVAGAFGLSRHDVEAHAGPLMPPQLILSAFVQSWAGAKLDPDHIPRQYHQQHDSDSYNYVDQLHFVAELARVSSWFACPRSTTVERARVVLSTLRDLSTTHAYAPGPCGQHCGVKMPEIGRLFGLRLGKTGVTGKVEALDALRKIIAPGGAKGGLVLRCIANASVVQRAPSHGTVATERTNLADNLSANWAGRKEYGTVVAILEQKFIQSLRTDHAAIRTERLATNLRHGKDKKLMAAMDAFEADLHALLRTAGASVSSYLRHYHALLTYKQPRETVESLQAKGFTAIGTGPYSDEELQRLRRAVEAYNADHAVIGQQSEMEWLAAKVRTRTAQSVAVQLRRMLKQVSVEADYQRQLAALAGTDELDATTVQVANEEDNPRAFEDEDEQQQED